jgi:AraC-like DNA-binding protein
MGVLSMFMQKCYRIESWSCSFHVKIICVAIFLGFSFCEASAQITVVVTDIPSATPGTDTLYITGDFNNWNPGDRNYILQKTKDKYSITLPENIDRMEFKITRGSWPKVESNIYNKSIDNRVFKISKKGEAVTHFVRVAGWEDIRNIHTWDIIVKKVPANTPLGSPIFISGTFNEWREHDERFQLVQLENGSYTVKIPKGIADTLKYKFHRGLWSSVEASVTGRFRENRVSVWDNDQVAATINCEISGWTDIRSGVNFLLHVILISAALQCIWLIALVLSIDNRNYQKTRPLVLILALTFIALAANLLTYNSQNIDAIAKLLLLSDITSVLYAPLLYYFIIEIAGIRKPNSFLKWVFISALTIFAIIYFYLITIPSQEFFLKLINQQFDLLFTITTFSAYVYNCVVWIFCLLIIIKEKDSVNRNYYFQNAFSYLVMIMTATGLCLLVWGFSLIAHGLNFMVEFNTNILAETGYDILWACFGLAVYAHGYMVFRKSRLFMLRKEDDEKHKTANPQKENLSALKSELLLVMQKHKPYLNANLTLQDLSDIMKINIHTLSWLINEGYKKNFFDFINEYRIEEFKSIVAQNKNQTFLSIAIQVGFSSKTTFNRAFKKYTGKTPREYFNHIKDSRIADFDN